MGGWIKWTPGCYPGGTEATDHCLKLRLEEGLRSRVLSLPELTRLVVRGWGSESSQEWGLRQLAAISHCSVAGLKRTWPHQSLEHSLPRPPASLHPNLASFHLNLKQSCTEECRPVLMPSDQLSIKSKRQANQ